MRIAPPTADEQERLDVLHRLQILDTEPEAVFDAITRLAADLMGTPIALVSLVDASRQWFKSRVGVEVAETPRDIAFCAHAIHGSGPFLVPDARADERFADNPLVTGGVRIRAYAGVPLRTMEGHAVGTLCAIDPRPRAFTERELRQLQDLALVAEHEIRTREATSATRALVDHAFERGRRQEARYRAIVDAAAAGIAVVGPGGEWRMVNARMAELLGRPADALAGLSFRELTHPDDIAGDVEARDRLLRGEVARAQREKRYVHPDGRVVWVSVEAALAVPESGGEPELILVAEDITARREAEASLQALYEHLEVRVAERTRELREVNAGLADALRRLQDSEAALAASEQELRAILENALDAFVAIDTEGVVVAWNLQAEKTFGWRREEALGQRLETLILPERHRASHLAGLARLRDSGEARVLGRRIELPAVARDGHEIPCEVSIARVATPGGGTLFAAFLQDISERLRVTRLLATSESRLAAVLDDQAEIVCRVRRDGRISFANRSAQRAFRIAGRQDAAPARWPDPIDPRDRRQAFQVLRTLGPGEAPMERLRYRGVDGVDRWGEFEFRLAREDADHPEEVQVVGRDVTDRVAMEAKVAELHARLQDLYDHAPCGYHSVGPDGLFVNVNEVELDWLGATREEVVGRCSPADFLDEAGARRYREGFATFMQSGRAGSMDATLVGRHGRERRVSLRATAIYDDQGRFVMSRAVMFDNTEVHRARQALEAAHRQQALMLDNDLVGIVKLRQRTATWHNRALARIFGYTDEELDGQPARLLYGDDETYERVGREAYPVLRDGGTFRAQVPMRHRSGRTLWIDMNGALLDADGEESLWMMQDVTGMKEERDRAEHLAMHDLLTGLPNRSLLVERLSEAIAAGPDAAQTVAVCFLDLNGFKGVNDTMGHAAGDELLRVIARRLKDLLRGGDTVARLGGDEFVLLLTQLERPEAARPVLDRVIDAVGRPVTLRDGRVAQVSASIGIAFHPQQAGSADALLALADASMYDAKRARTGWACGHAPFMAG